MGDIAANIAHQDFIKLGAFTISDTMIISWCIMVVLVLVSKMITRNLKMVPGKIQSLLELFITFIKEIAEGTLGKKTAKDYIHIGGTLFIYIFICNIIDIFPFPFLRTPTSDLTFTVGLAVMIFFMSQIGAVKKKGFFKHYKGLFEPNIFLFPLNVVGELAKPVSHSFRLFGNITGGAIIVAIIGSFVNDILLPVFLQGYFGLFQGLLQSFIFMMIAFAYLGNAIGGDE
jgi:F-type H+-transporting ATPase subunit a